MDILDKDANRHLAALSALAEGRHADPFAVLGLHPLGHTRIVRVLQPAASAVELLKSDGSVITDMRRVHDAGIFVAELPPRLQRYRLRVHFRDDHSIDMEDPYRFAPCFDDRPEHVTHDWLGSRIIQHEGTTGTRFAVWAPNARRVSLVGDFNGWDGRVHVMRRHAVSGVWELFLPGIGAGTSYKYELIDANGKLLPLKSDPHAERFETAPGTASIVFQSGYRWGDDHWMAERPGQSGLDRPISIYEVHPGSWKRKGEFGETPLTYPELAIELVNYVRDMGFTHLELLPVTEHPFDGSWGYQPIGMFAATSRFGTPDDLRYLIDCCHRAGIAVIVDWVGAHFPRDDHGLRRFDGTALYEHDDPRRAEHLDWGTLIFNYGRPEVVEYLVGSARFWVEEMHVDGLRVDAVASMLYLDYGRKGAEWLPNEHGGNENLEAVAFLKKMNEVVHASGATTFAEESTTWPGVSKPVYDGGLGFTYKWNLGWMNDSLDYIKEDPLFRKYHHDKMTFGLVYAFEENFVLPLSHDEVVHGKRSLLGRMPGDEWQRFANYRAYLAFQYCHPGKKLLFMGAEIAQQNEWNYSQSLDWHLLQSPLNAGIKRLVQDLNCVYRETPALYEIDFEHAGFEWLIADDRENSAFAWLRRARNGKSVVCAVNYTPMVRHDYEIPVNESGDYQEILNTDAEIFGGSNVENSGTLTAREAGNHAGKYALRVTLPPLAMIVLQKT